MRRLLAPLLALAFFPAQAQDWYVGVQSLLSQPVIDLSDIDEASNEADFRTNNKMVPGIEIRYKHYGLVLAQPLSGTSRKDPLLPPTRFFDVRTFYHGSRWGVEAYHQYFRGFSTLDRAAVSSGDYASLSERTLNLNVFRGATKGSKVYHITEGIGRTGFRANLYYLAGLSRQGFRSPVPLKDSATDSSGVFAGLRRVTAYGAFGGLGTTLNLNLAGFYLDPTLFIGGGPQYRQANTEMSDIGAQFKVHLQFRAGYQGDRWDVGLSVENDLNSIELDDSRGILFHSIAVKMHAGLSF